jgi:hypothetical protein
MLIWRPVGSGLLISVQDAAAHICAAVVELQQPISIQWRVLLSSDAKLKRICLPRSLDARLILKQK